MRLLNIAALQISPITGDPEATLRDFERRVEKLRRTLNGLQLVVIPELHLAAVGGFFADESDDPERLAVEIPGLLTDRLCALARANDVWLVPGSLYERGEEGGVHNTAIAISADGEI